MPSHSPTLECSYLVVTQCDPIFDDIYKRSIFSTNGKASYDSQHISASRVFRQDSLWIISRVGYSEYLIADFSENDFYPILKIWNQTDETNNILTTISECVVICRSNMFPTLSPSSEPSTEPSIQPTFFTNNPTFVPTVIPTGPPSISPLVSGILQKNYNVLKLFLFFHFILVLFLQSLFLPPCVQFFRNKITFLVF